MKKPTQEKYQHLKTGKIEYFTFIGAHRYKRNDGVEFNVMALRKEYLFISEYSYSKTPIHPKWEHNPATGFNVRKAV